MTSKSLSQEELEAMLGLASLKHTKVYQEIEQEVRAEALQKGRREGEQKAKVEVVVRMLTHDFGIRAITEILDLRADVVADAAVVALLKAKLNAPQIAKRLEMELGQVTFKALRILLAEGRSEAETAQQLGVTLAAVRRVMQPKPQHSESSQLDTNL